MAKSKTTKRSDRPKRKKSKRNRDRDISAPQTQQPFEQDVKRRIGQFGGAGEPPLMKK